MLEETNKPNADTSQSQTNANADNTNKETSLMIEHEKIEDTPFNVTFVQDNGWFIRMGDYRLSQLYQTKYEALQALKTDQWNIIQRLVAAMIAFAEQN